MTSEREAAERLHQFKIWALQDQIEHERRRHKATMGELLALTQALIDGPLETVAKPSDAGRSQDKENETGN